MRIFVTGATGFIGSAVVTELIEAGHAVVGLARSDEGAAALAAAGAQPHRGSLEDLDSLHAGAVAADGVIHTAFVHDFSRLQDSGRIDLEAVETLAAALEGRPLIITSGTALVASGRTATENDMSDPAGAGSHRAPSEHAALAAGGAVVRFPPTVHGAGDHGFVPVLIDAARARGVSAYVGDCSNRWAAVHRLDAARLFRLAIESAPAGSVFHGVGEEGIPTRAIAEVIGRHLDVPVTSISPDEALEHFGWIGRFFALDVPASSAITQERLGWQPVHPGLLEDLEAGHYFPMALRR